VHFSGFFHAVSRKLQACDIIVAPPFTAISTAAELGRHQYRHLGPDVSEQRRRFPRRSFRANACRSPAATSSSATPSARQLFRETDDNVAKKTLVGARFRPAPIVCLGECRKTAIRLGGSKFSSGIQGRPRALTPERFSVF